MGKGNGQKMVGGRYHCIMVRSFDFILGAIAAFYGRIFDFYRKGISTLLIHCRGAKIILNVHIDGIWDGNVFLCIHQGRDF